MDLMRPISAGMQAALSAPFFYPVAMVYLDWPGGVLRMHSGAGSITWGGESWSGVGGFGEVSVPDEALGGVPVEFSLSLICPFAELASYADAVIRQRAGRIYLGATTEPGMNTLVGDPVEIASGTMDTMVLSIETSGSTSLYQLTVGLATGPGYRTSAAIAHSHEDQSRQYPGDTAGLRLMAAMARAENTQWPEP